MSTLNLSLRLSAVAFALATRALSVASDPSDMWRGWYLVGTGPSPMITLNFNLDASFWVATMRLDSDHQVNIQQNSSSCYTSFHRAANQSEVDSLPKGQPRLFFDARFPKRNPAAFRMVMVRRVKECGTPIIYVEPMP